MVWGPKQPAELPLVLVGPMLRRVDPTSVTVFLALKEARTATLRVYDSESGGAGSGVVATGSRSTVSLGTNLHVVAVTATAAAPLAPGRLYRYQVFFGAAGGAEAPESAPTLFSAGVVAPTEAAARAALTFGTAGAPRLPSFATPPPTPATLRLLHGSCRKPHGGGLDMLPVVADIIAPAADSAELRPHQLLLTGDQIYADDVADPLLAIAAHAMAALGMPREQLPAKKRGALLEDRHAEVGMRQHAVLEIAKLTCDVGASHLFSFAEFVGMYLLVWADVLWPQTLPEFGDEFPHLKRDMGEETYSKTLAGEAYPAMVVPESVKRMQRWVEQAKPLQDFRDSLPEVRRALANVPTLMMFDDHEVTDDWLLCRRWCTDSVIAKDADTGSRLGRRIAANAMAACAIFQAWGNTPDRFAAQGDAGQKGRDLLTKLSAWTAGSDDASVAAAEDIAQRVGTPVDLSDAPKDTDVDPPRERGKLLQRADTAIDYHYEVRWPRYQLIVLDTRTRRGFPGGPTDPPALIGDDVALRAMLHDLGDPADDGVTVVVSPAPVVGVPLIEDFIQPLVGRSYAGSVFTDNEAWGLQQAGLQSFLPRLCTAATAAADGTHSRRVVLLSGDVHYGYAARLRFSARAPHTAPGAPAALASTRVEGVAAQLVSSSLKNEEGKTRFLHSTGFEPVLDRLPERRIVGWRNEAGASIQVGNELGLGWGGSGLRPWKVSGRPAVGEVTDTRVVTSEPDIRAEISFVKHDEADPEVPPRDVAARDVSAPGGDTQQALAQYLAAAGNHQDYLGPWGSGKEIVGRVNLGEIRFLWGAEDRKSVAQTLWWRLERGADRQTAAPLTRYVVDLALGSTLFQPPRYGGFLLQRGDKDAAADKPPTYGGVERKGYTGPAHVATLQRDLLELGFAQHRTATGEFDRLTQFAVRELQVYAARSRVAVDVQPVPRPSRYVESLRAVDVPTGDRYRGIVHGSVDLPTEAVITTWKERRWRCPVIVEGWTTNAAGDRLSLATIPATPTVPSRPAENLWRHDECPVATASYFVTDLSTVPAGAAAGAPRLLAGWDAYATVEGFGGPRRDPLRGQRSPELEVRPEVLLPRVADGAAGPSLAALVADRGSSDTSVATRAAQRLSSFKVLRAVSEVRSDGQLDAVRAHAEPALAVGLGGWGSGRPVSPPQIEGPKPLRDWSVAEGDLLPLLAYLRRRDPDTFEAVAGRFGLSASKAWGKDGGDLLDKTHLVLAALPALTDRSGEAKAIDKVADHDYLRSWHWVNRVVTAVAEQDGLRRSMWLLARQRLADLLSAPWDGPLGAPTVPDLPAGDKTRRARIGDLVTSERGVALLLAWHQADPGAVVGPGPDTEMPKEERAKPRAGARLHAAFDAAKASGAADFSAPTTAWTDTHEQALTAALLAGTTTDATLHTALVAVLAWPAWTPSGGTVTATNPRGFALPVDALPAGERTLLGGRGSFRLDVSDLPRSPA
ncbi:hypothetical protein [Humibacillus xanthopallidus]|uniref:PhoD-like phosphatase n=1 Tax=Humibacillus xanthopallidus TaxID=412689 RepID=A0A543HZZ3_9MICO|nr:hypothetical protein [Humibacillus xanthopallidus]TQM63850.1 hypothetical protein FBY41_0204 [Humibacillus xanthopallidus]